MQSRSDESLSDTLASRNVPSLCRLALTHGWGGQYTAAWAHWNTPASEHFCTPLWWHFHTFQSWHRPLCAGPCQVCRPRQSGSHTPGCSGFCTDAPLWCCTQCCWQYHKLSHIPQGSPPLHLHTPLYTLCCKPHQWLSDILTPPGYHRLFHISSHLSPWYREVSVRSSNISKNLPRTFPRIQCDTPQIFPAHKLPHI